MKLILPVILIFTIALGVLPFFIEVGNIKCQQASGDCREETLYLLSSANNQNIKKSRKIISKSLDNDVDIKNYTIKNILPNNLEVNIIYRVPTINLRHVGFATPLVLDEDGEVLNTQHENSLPLLIIDGNVKENDLSLAIQLTLNLNKFYGIKNFTLRDGSLYVKNESGITMILPVNKDLDTLLGATSLTLSQLNSELQGIKIEEIDFRYKNPIAR